MDRCTQAAGSRDWDESIILALGSNLALEGRSPAQTLDRALEALSRAGLRVCERSRVWRSAAWPDASDPAFLNLVVRIETALSPEALMSALHAVEAAFGRARTRPNAPRPLDLDLVAYGRRVQDGALVLPHPRAAERLFVMGPLAEVAPHWRHPALGETAEALAARASVGRDARPLTPDGDEL